MTSSRSEQRPAEFFREHAFVIVACALAIVLYARLLNAPFLTWDDDKNIYQNPYYLYEGWWRLWAEPYYGLFVPVIGTVWAALFKFGSGSSLAYRVFNLAVHALNSILVARLLSGWFARRSLTGPNVNAAIGIGVAVFALHPLQTAAVAWISGGRDLTATAFGLAAILVASREGNRAFVSATVLFVLGLLCKPSIAGLPLAIVAHDAFFERPRLATTLRRMALWSAIVVVLAVGTSLIQTDAGKVNVSIWRRPIVALDAIGFYLLETVWPAALSGDHGRTPDRVRQTAGLLIPTLGACAVAAFGIWRSRRAPEIQVWLWLFVLALLPVLGLVPFGFQRISTVADHYMYLPIVAVSGLVATLALRIPRPAQVAGFAAISLVMAAASWSRLGVWRDSEALYADVLEKNPESFSALTNLTQLACTRGELERGLGFAERSLAINPTAASTLANKAYCLFSAGRSREVVAMIPQLRNPAVVAGLEDDDAAASSLANVIAGSFFQLGDPNRGGRFLCQAAAIAPNDESLKQNLAGMSRELAAKGMSFRCGSRVPWREFLERAS